MGNGQFNVIQYKKKYLNVEDLDRIKFSECGYVTVLNIR